MASTLGFGEPAPTFVAHAIGGNANYHFDTVAGRPVLLLFFAGAGSGMAVPACGRLPNIVPCSTTATRCFSA